MPDGISIWNRVLKTALRLPGIKVDRASFLRKELSPYMPAESVEAVILGRMRIPKELRDRITDDCIKYQLTIACGISAAAGVPGGFALFATIPADVAQYYAQVIILIQKMLYIYGWADLRDTRGQFNDATLGLLTIWIAVMTGNSAALAALRTALESLKAQALTRIPQMVLGHSAVHTLVKELAGRLGKEITKKNVAQASSKIIPLIGAPIGASITYLTFKPMARRLKKQLDSRF
jgi:hypothetical protein